MGLTEGGGWFESVERRPEGDGVSPADVRAHQEVVLRGRLFADLIDAAEFERGIGFLVAADEWGWDDGVSGRAAR